MIFMICLFVPWGVSDSRYTYCTCTLIHINFSNGVKKQKWNIQGTKRLEKTKKKLFRVLQRRLPDVKINSLYTYKSVVSSAAEKDKNNRTIGWTCTYVGVICVLAL